jgi:hypothetical protein
MIFGAALIGAGFYVEREWDEELAYVLWITGGVSVVGGGASLVFKTEVERMANAYGVYTTSAPTPEQEADLERDWEKAALKAKGARQIGGAVALGLAAISFGSAVYVLAADPVEEETQHWLVPTILVSGASTAAAGVVALMIESPTEAAYGQYKASRTAKPPASDLTNWRVGATPLSNGGFVSVSTVF